MFKFKLDEKLLLNQDVDFTTDGGLHIQARSGSEVIVVEIDQEDEEYPYYVFFSEADECAYLTEDDLFEFTAVFI
ncbi:hypothetical protein [Niallia taxi]|uniref:hypothetical protein n=1 Tax=Niallia taxi TaxID=2499688 RepID=UPI00300A6E79